MTYILTGDCLAVMPTLEAESVDAIVSDPPYGLAFMGKAWDHGVPGPEFWREALRVAKPGAHLVAFGGTRTYHRLTCAIEDAGWEIRDCLSWLYGSGFPKSLDVSKAMDKMAGAEREVTGIRKVSPSDLGQNSGWNPLDTSSGEYRYTAPATDLAREWQGWGTALKPAWEPIILARKPLTGTVASNVAQYGTGALNVDGCRIAGAKHTQSTSHAGGQHGRYSYLPARGPQVDDGKGRWPANVCLDEEAARLLDEQTEKGMHSAGAARTGSATPRKAAVNMFGVEADTGAMHRFGDSGGASRFFYCAKAPAKERWGILTCDCQATRLPAWESEDQNHDAQTDATSPERGICAERLEGECASSTPPFGNLLTGRSPLDGKSTTPTVTSRTIDSTTCDSSPRQSTSASTLGANSATAFGGSRAESAASESPSTMTTGISAAKGGRSMGVVGPVTSLKSSATSVCGKCGGHLRVESHPTQKPIALMRWLCRLVTPKGGVILDPFTGSGTTGCAAVLEGFRFVGIEREPEYAAIAEKRIAHWAGQVDEPTLFD